MVVVGALPGRSAWGAEPGLQVDGELASWDNRCANTHMCDRYGLVFAVGTQVRVQALTSGFPAHLRAIAPGGALTSQAAPQPELQFFASPGVQYFIELNAADPSFGPYSLRISPAPSRWLPPPPPTAEQREPDARVRNAVAEMMRGYRSATPLLVGRLDQIPELRFPAKRGHCYRAVVILGRGARRATPATYAQMSAQVGSDARARVQTARSTERIMALDDDVCPPGDGTLEVTFREPGHALPSPSAGTGPFTLQLFERE